MHFFSPASFRSTELWCHPPLGLPPKEIFMMFLQEEHQDHIRVLTHQDEDQAAAVGALNSMFNEIVCFNSLKTKTDQRSTPSPKLPYAKPQHTCYHWNQVFCQNQKFIIQRTEYPLNKSLNTSSLCASECFLLKSEGTD